MTARANQQEAPPAATWGRRRRLAAASAAPQSAAPAAVSVAAAQVLPARGGQQRHVPRWVAVAARLAGRGSGYESFVIAYMICTALVLAFLLSCEEGRHWFIVPVFVCGVLVVADAVDWLRGRYDVFDPVGIFGVFGFYFFFAAPLIHVLWDKWMLWIVPPPDWRPWIGGMAFANLAGLVLYRLARGRPVPSAATPADRVAENPAHRSPASSAPRTRTVWTADTRSAAIAVGIGLAITAAVQAYVYASVGGLSGYIESSGRRDAFLGMAPLAIVGESFPLFAFIGFAIYARRLPGVRSWSLLAGAMLTYLVLLILFGGLRGSRMNTIWPLFWAVGVIHFWIRPVSRKVLAVGLCFVFGFMYVYGFYKSLRGNVFSALTSDSISEVEESTGRTLDLMLLGDLGRTDVQAFLLYRYMRPGSDFIPGYGQTYIGAATLFIPRWVWPNRPPGKTYQGTELQYGRGTWSERTASSRIYGLAGETLLNFGPWVIPFAFIPLGLFVRWVRRFTASLDPSDTRLMIVPFLVGCCVWFVIGDLDNVIWFMTKSAVLPFALLFVCSFAGPNAAVPRAPAAA